MKVMTVKKYNDSVMRRSDLDYNAKIPLLFRRQRDCELRQSGYVAITGNSILFDYTKQGVIDKADKKEA